MTNILGLQVSGPLLLLGVIVGLNYGLLAVGLVLIFRSNRILNFAHGEIGAFAAAIFGVAVLNWHIPYYLGLPGGIAVGALAAMGAEIAVIRRLRKAPRLMSIVATLGVGQILILFASLFSSQAVTSYSYPQPPGLPQFHVGALLVTPAYSGMLIAGPIAVLLLVLFFRFSRFGIAVRGAAANPEAARMAGISASRMSSLAWGLAGGLSALTAILIAPSRGFVSGATFGPDLLLRALAAAVVAQMSSLPIALAAGIGLGVIEQVLIFNNPSGGTVDAVIFGIILVGMLLQRSIREREEEKGSWAAVSAWRPLAAELRQNWVIRNLGGIFAAILLAVAISVPMLVTNSTAAILVLILTFAMVGLSVGVVTGLSGQLSLGQFAIAGIGAAVSVHVYHSSGNIGLAVLDGGLAGAAASVLVGVPALRVRGLMLPVTTLGLALIAPVWLLQQNWLLGTGVDTDPTTVGPFTLVTGKQFYYFGLGILVILVVLARNARSGGLGRLLIAVRDNEDNARAFSVRSLLLKVQAFLLAGFIAGVAGAVYGQALSRVSADAFSTTFSVDAVASTVIGGIGVLGGPLLGAFYIRGIPAFFPLDSASLAATKLGWLILILYAPGGIAQILQPLRDRLVRVLAGWLKVRPPDEAAADQAQFRELTIVPTALSRDGGSDKDVRPAMGSVLLEAQDLHKQFGGVKAVGGVSLSVARGEIVGLIGPNGAGKTTLFELLGGFTRPDRGKVILAGRDVTWLDPELRARLGLVRSFQDAALFPTMTVFDVLCVAFERRWPTTFFASVFAVSGRERKKQQAAEELISMMGLRSYRDKQIQELSTGTRRITELGCMIALQPELLLLDEPSSGIAQRETEALGALLANLKKQLDTTMVIIEHDIPLIMGLADRMIAMDGGQVIATGTPAEVRQHPKVIESYLGGSMQAIQRSGVLEGEEVPA